MRSDLTDDGFAQDPILVFGAPRSGTTYLQQILNANPAVFISHESRVFAWLHHALEVLAQDDRYLVTYRDDFVEHLRTVLPQSIRDFYFRLAPEASFWGDKNPHYADALNTGCLELVAELFPGSRFIHIVRDGRDVVSSLMRKKDAEGKPWVDFESAHWTWMSHVDNGCSFGRALPPKRYFELRYEDLISDDLGIAVEVFEFLGLGLHPAVQAFCESEREARTPFSDPTRDFKEGIGVSDWPKIFNLEDQAHSLELIGAHLVRYGYETDVTLADFMGRTVGALAEQKANLG